MTRSNCSPRLCERSEAIQTGARLSQELDCRVATLLAMTGGSYDQKTNREFHFPVDLFKYPANAEEYSKLQEVLDQLVDLVRDDESHELSLIMQIIGDNLERYDDEHYPPIGNNVSPIEAVKYLMKRHNLRQKDLADIFGGQANVSKFLNGERTLTKRQIVGLKRRFKISADFFI